MYSHPTLVTVTLLQLLFVCLTSTAPATAPQETIVAAFNRTASGPPFNLTLSEALLNENLKPLPNFISYRVPDSPATLHIHSLGAPIPTDQFFDFISLAVTATVNLVKDGKGKTPISLGFFKYTRVFTNHDEVEIVVSDFRETGRWLTYRALLDVVRGVGEFMIEPGQRAQELDFEVDFQGRGYLGTGHVGYKPSQTSTSDVA